MLILTDADIDPVAAMPVALEAIEAALRAKATGDLVAPPRHRVAFPSRGNLFFTIGGDANVAGFRVYDTFGGPAHGQLTAVWSVGTGELTGLVLGERLGAIRTGAIGGIAIRHMSAPGAATIGVIGGGHQARSQLLAAAAVRPLEHAKVFSRSPEGRNEFARDITKALAFPVEPVMSAEEAVREADIVVCATSSETPVIDAAWLKPGAHVNTVGPKTIAAHEIGIDVAQRAAVIATDSLVQTQSYGTPFFLDCTETDRMIELSRIVAGEMPGRTSEADITLFCSAGLAGTEVLVADRLLTMASTGADIRRVV